jgi:RNA polymerase sigma factor (sigma-70 family)
LLLRRYRADRLLHEEFEGLRAAVTAAVAARLRAAAAPLDASDLEACYAQAWQGLHTAILEGQTIASPAAWLTVVMHRRAIDELRTCMPREAAAPEDIGREPDLAAELDDRRRLRSLLEGLRGRLSLREQQAATLCYLHGLSRAEAAARMGVSESRMRKLMDGAGDGLAGVAAKVGALARTIRSGGWCEQQGSLMRGFAFGILDPRGERYRLARLHSEDCSACRAYVLSLRGLAALLPPLPSLHLLLGAGSAAGIGAGAGAGLGTGAGAGAGVGAGSGAAAATGGAGATGAATAAPTAAGLAGGALSGSGVAGLGAAGGGWWLAGGVGAKLAVGCLLALGVGAGCVALDGSSHGAHGPARHRHARARATSATSSARTRASGGPSAAATLAATRGASSPAAENAPTVAPAARAGREFGPEQASTAGAEGVAAARRTAKVAAHVASARSSPATGSAAATQATAAPSGGGASSGSQSAAQREFAPG